MASTTLCEFRNQQDQKLYYLANQYGDLATCSAAPLSSTETLPTVHAEKCTFPMTNELTSMPCKTAYDVNRNATAFPMSTDSLIGMDASHYRFAVSRLSDNLQIQNIMNSYTTMSSDVVAPNPSASSMNLSMLGTGPINGQTVSISAIEPKTTASSPVRTPLSIERESLSTYLKYQPIPNFAPASVATPQVESRDTGHSFKIMLAMVAVLAIVAIIISGIAEIFH